MIPSLLQIPSAVSDSKLHSVLPNNGKGDFTFDRSTGATRINKDGLIEEVGYFSSELVQNGDFSELGSELIVNGDFSNGLTGFSTENVELAEGGVRIQSDGSSGSFIAQSGILTSGKTYKLVFEVKGVQQSGSLRVGFSSVGSVSISDIGTQTLYFVAGGTQFELVRNSAINVIIDNVSVKQVDPNDRWFSLGTGWSFGDGVVSSDGSQSTNSDCTQNMTTDAGKTYKITYTISEYSAGGVFIRLASGNVTTTQTSAGTFSENLSAIGGTQIRIRANSTFVGTISNISIVEVQGDRPRLSYDITNGVVEDQPHLLLEPSATNLVSDSNNQNDSWFKTNVTFSKNTVTSPDGTQNASTLDFSAIDGMFRFITASGNPDTKTFTASVYLKAGTATSAKIRILGSSGGLGILSENVTLTNDWQRFSVTSSFSGTGDNVRIRVQSLEVGTMYFFGGQVEEQSYATSYIPTAGTTITRAAETCNNSKPSINSTEGVLYAEIGGFTNTYPSASVLTISSGNYNNSVRIAFHTVINQIEYRIVTGGVIQAFARHTISDITQFNKIAVKYKANDFALWINGNQVLTDTSGSLPSAGTFNEVAFDDGNGDADFYGKVKGLAVYNEALTDAQLIQLTS